MLNALVISVLLVAVVSLLRRIRLTNYLRDRQDAAYAETLQYLADMSHDLKLLSSLTIEESGQVSFLALVPDDTVILRFNGYVIDYGSLLSYERGNSDYITVYN